MVVQTAPRHGYAVVCDGWVSPAGDLEQAARQLAAAYAEGKRECRIKACQSLSRRRPLHEWERRRLIELAVGALSS